MMKLRTIWMMVAVLALSLVAGCNDEEVDIADTQRKAIESYLTSSHSPRLINVVDVPNSLEPEPPFYERIDFTTYRYIASYYDEGRSARRAVQVGDEVSLTFMACVFTGSTPSLGAVYSTNDLSVIAQLGDAGLNTQYWSSEPLKIKIGQTNIIKGVEQSLIGCREGDSVEAYIILDTAYEDNVVGVVPEESSVVWFYTIDSVASGQ